MNDQNKEAGRKLQKLGKRLRVGLAKPHRDSHKAWRVVQDAVREQYPKDMEKLHKELDEKAKKKPKIDFVPPSAVPEPEQEQKPEDL